MFHDLLGRNSSENFSAMYLPIVIIILIVNDEIRNVVHFLLLEMYINLSTAAELHFCT